MNYSTIEHMRIAVSNYCNLKCKHCYAFDCTREDLERCEKNQLTTAQIKEFIDMLIADFGLKKVSLTGGEPLAARVWPRTKEILEHCLEKDLNVQLNTSGSGEVGIDEIVTAAGQQKKNILLHASLDGTSEDTVDSFRGCPGAYKRAIKTITDAVRNRISVQVRYTLTCENFDQAESCYELVSQMGVESFMIKPIYLAGSAKGNKELVPDADAIKRMQTRLIKMSKGNPTRLDLPRPVYADLNNMPDKANIQIINCICGVKAGYITYDGNVYPCTYIAGANDSEKYILGNLKDKSFDFAKAWNSPYAYTEYRSAPADVCTTYEILTRCR
ncbi:MAG TPA: radical SAM protein [Clostridia bacterium]|nr:radical SAM protein [Clostridia bacterium]